MSANNINNVFGQSVTNTGDTTISQDIKVWTAKATTAVHQEVNATAAFVYGLSKVVVKNQPKAWEQAKQEAADILAQFLL